MPSLHSFLCLNWASSCPQSHRLGHWESSKSCLSGLLNCLHCPVDWSFIDCSEFDGSSLLPTVTTFHSYSLFTFYFALLLVRLAYLWCFERSLNCSGLGSKLDLLPGWLMLHFAEDLPARHYCLQCYDYRDYGPCQLSVFWCSIGYWSFGSAASCAEHWTWCCSFWSPRISSIADWTMCVIWPHLEYSTQIQIIHLFSFLRFDFQPMVMTAWFDCCDHLQLILT